MDEQKTFNQEELNSILKERLSKERTKMLSEISKREAELAHREAVYSAKAEWTKKGLPAELIDSLDLTREGALESASAILERMTNNNKPVAYSGGFERRQVPNIDDMGDTVDPIRKAMGL